jgi:uncharacterized protein (TIGR03083 family)
VEHLEHCDALADEVERLARAVGDSNTSAHVISCPGWRVIDVAEHVGRVHRWAYELVRRRPPTRLSSPVLELTETDITPAWLLEGGAQLVHLLRETDPDVAMWAWGVDQPVRFWSRRQLHETLVHRMDVELASGVDVTTTSDVAVDAIDELLMNLRSAAAFSPGVRALRGDGQRLSIQETKTGAGWTITLHEDGFEVTQSAQPSDTSMVGPAVDLLLTLYRRMPLGGSSVRVEGDADLAAFWIEHSALQ